jgi:hypothetical protein
LRARFAGTFTNKCKFSSHKDAQSGKVTRRWENDQDASDKRLPEQLLDLLRHDLIGAMEVDTDFLSSSADGTPNPMSDGTAEATPGGPTAFDKRTHKVDEYQGEVDIDNDIASQQWDGGISLQTNVTASVREKFMQRLDESSDGSGDKAACDDDCAPQPQRVAVSWRISSPYNVRSFEEKEIPEQW